MQDVCSICEGAGLVVVERADGSRAARECICLVERRLERRYQKAQIPELYLDRSLESYKLGFEGVTTEQKAALDHACKYVEEFPSVRRGTGLLFTGPVGTGKTHLAVGVFKALMDVWGKTGLFCHYSELLKQIQNSYNKHVQATELEILAPIFEAEILVLDEVGASKPTEWVKDTVGHILNVRYNERRTTIVTTNYPNLAEISLADRDRMTDTQRAMYAENLGDRIGERMRSRLQEMCLVVPMDGIDFRSTEKKAKASFQVPTGHR